MELDKLRQERTKIVATSNLRLENVDCFYSPDRIPFNSTERLYIDKEWTQEVRKKPIIFDGKLFHVKRQEFLLSQLIFHTCKSSFKEWVGTKDNKFKLLFGQNRVVRPLSVGTMIITSDDRWIIGRRQKTYDFEGQYTLLAGYMSPDKDIVNSKPDPFIAIKREIEEETGISKDQDIRTIKCLGVDGTNQPYLAFTTQLRLSHNEMISKKPAEKEFRKLEGYQHDKKTLKDFIVSKYKEMTPHTLSHMLMSYDLLEP